MNRLVVAAHGTRDPGGVAVIEGLVAAVRERLPGTEVDLGWISVASPGLGEVLADGQGAVIVPALLGSGYHVLVDIPQFVTDAPRGAVATAHLGPDRRVVRALAQRVRSVDPEPVAVVLAAAGTSHPVGRSEARQAAEMLGTTLGVPVTVAYASGQGPEVAGAVTEFRATGAARVVVAPYLLAPGMFADRIRTAASTSGAACADVLGTHPDIVELVVERYLAASRTGAGQHTRPASAA